MLSFFWFYILRLRVSLVKNQISRVFPNMTPHEISKTTFKSFYNLIMIVFEYSYFPFNKKKIVKYTKLKNLDIVDKTIKSGKPLFFMTGHLANGELIVFRMCLEGYKLNLIGKRVGVKFIDSLLFEIRELSGLKHIPPKNGATGIMEAAQKKEPVIFVHDQFRHPPRGLKTTFLGLETYTNSALAFFALKTGAEVIPVDMYRENDQVVAEFMPSIPFENKFDTEEENILHMTQVYNDALELCIKKRPQGWMWVHKRWKQPSRK
ncbi:MAG: lysophospholipid acyltransferase family protein [Bdellovibrionales bacterium]